MLLLIFVNISLYAAMANLHTYGWCLHYFVAVFFVILWIQSWGI